MRAVDEDNRIVGIGYNGLPRGCSDDAFPWAREAESVLDTKYPYVCHAEMNAIMNKNTASIKHSKVPRSKISRSAGSCCMVSFPQPSTPCPPLQSRRPR